MMHLQICNTGHNLKHTSKDTLRAIKYFRADNKNSRREAHVAKKLSPRANAKRANRPNPRIDRNPNIEEFEIETRSPQKRVKKKVQLIPRNLSQERYVDLLLDPEKHIVFAMGPAGTGKTMLATQYAIKCLMEGIVEKIIITRPAVSVDENHGYLPGTLVQKLTPWCLPILDVLKEHFSVQAVEKMIADEVIELAPLSMMRGRSLKNAIILLDESQNATPNQMKMMLTRIGEGSRMIVTGDIKQHDRGFEQNGLKDFIHRLEENPSKAIAVCHFSRDDVERHEIIEEVLKLYGDE